MDKRHTVIEISDDDEDNDRNIHIRPPIPSFSKRFKYTEPKTYEEFMKGLMLDLKDVQMKAQMIDDTQKVVESLLAKYQFEHINSRDSEGRTLLWHVASTNDLKALRILITQPGIKVNVRDTEGKSALYIACEKGFTDCVRTLLQHYNININIREHKGQTPLQHAAQEGHVECVKL